MTLLWFAIGGFGVSVLPWIPPAWWLAAPLVFALFIRHRPIGRTLLPLLSGVLWGVVTGHHLLNHQLPPNLELDEFSVTGTVYDLPDQSQRRVRFKLKVDQCLHRATGTRLPLKQLLLSWYNHFPEITPGQRWQLTVKLRRPRGFANPGGFDYRGWLLLQGISATGHIRGREENRLISQETLWPDTLRYPLRRVLQEQAINGQQRALLQALILGDSSALSAEQWGVLSGTGTTHLLIISGLHIGLFALFCYGIGAFVGRLVNLCLPRCPASLVAAFLSMVGALFYAGLAGFGLPAVRALVMVAVVLLVKFLRTRVSAFTGLAVALAVVAVLDPLAIHSSGFWLSFCAVASLLWVFVPQRGALSWLQKLWRPQWVVFVALLTLLLMTFGQVPLISPLINILAIPLVSFVIVPLCLLGVMVLPVSLVAAEICWQLAAYSLKWLWQLLEFVSQWGEGSSLVSPIPLTGAVSLILLFGSIVLLLPKGMPGRWLGVMPLTLLMMASPSRPALSITILDVGQGLAVVVQTQRHCLVYDTGARFSDKFDAGSGVVAPYLRSQAVTAVDQLMVSHGDNDHAGGAEGLIRALPVLKVMSGEPLPASPTSNPCRIGMSWLWDGVLFEVLSPVSEEMDRSNNRSCVLLINYQGHRILLPGDIESEIEVRLSEQTERLGDIDLLVAPHHGSKTSSTVGFVDLTRPKHVVYSAGFRHHFRHPHSDVEKRYRQVGSQAWYTAQSGAITFTLSEGQWSVAEHRSTQLYYWQ